MAFGVFSQVQIGASRMFGGVRYVWDGYFALRGAHDENQRLKEQVAALELRLQQQQALARRGAQLEQMLAVREQTSLKTLAANVIALDATGMFWTVTIDRGSDDGVKPDMAVIAPQGVVGRVVDSPAFEAAKVQLLDRSQRRRRRGDRTDRARAAWSSATTAIRRCRWISSRTWRT